MTDVTIDSIALQGVVNVQRTGGWETAEEAVDRSTPYHTFVETEPVSATIEAWVGSETFQQLEELRQSDDPFPASIGDIGIPEAKLDDVVVEDEGGTEAVQPVGGEMEKGFRVTIEIDEIEFAELDSAEITFETGDVSSSADSADEQQAGTQEDSGGLLSGVADSVESAANNVASSLGF